MANVTLAQHEQLLKQLEHSLNEIGDQHQLIHNSLADAHTYFHQAQETLDQVWSRVVNLFAIVEKIRRTRLEFEQNKH